MSRPSSLLRLSPERRFGLTFALILAAFGGCGFLREWEPFRLELLAAGAGAFVLLAATAPQALRPLHRAWLRFGELLGRIASPVVLGVLFFGVLTPIALISRLAGRDELRLRARDAGTCWLDRQPSDSPFSFKNQF